MRQDGYGWLRNGVDSVNGQVDVLRPLLVVHSGDPGGSNEVVVSLIRHRPADVEPACLFLADGPAPARVRELGVPVEVQPAGPARHLWRAPKVVQSIRRAAEQHRAGLLFAHVRKAHLYASAAARLDRLPYLWWEHDPPSTAPGVRLAARLPADWIICSSEFTASHQRSLGGSAQVSAVLCGVEVDPAAPVAEHATDSPPIVVSVGRLRRYKRHELLVRAAPRVLASCPATRFRIIGASTPGVDEDYPAELHALSRSLGISQSIDFAGFVSGAGGVMHEASVLVHLAEAEPFGLVVVEAMLQGVPVICPRDGGPAEIVRDGVDGIHVDPEDVEELAQAIVTLVSDAGLRGRMGEEGRERATRCFAAERMARETWKIVADVARSRS